jgi:hypothetical protein
LISAIATINQNRTRGLLTKSENLLICFKFASALLDEDDEVFSFARFASLLFRLGGIFSQPEKKYQNNDWK